MKKKVPAKRPRTRAASSASPPAPAKKLRVTKTTVTWEGFTLSVSYKAQARFSGFAHLEIQVIAPERNAPLPITSTGYRSHFLLCGLVEEAGGPAAFVRRWLTEAAQSPRWRNALSAGDNSISSPSRRAKNVAPSAPTRIDLATSVP
jgi:hypothetical protein